MAGANDPTNARTVYTHIQGRARLFSDPASDAVAPASALALTANRDDFSLASSLSKDELPVASITAGFYTNSFPSAKIVIPVGKPADSDASGDVIRARQLAERLKTFQRIEVVVNISGEYAPDVKWPGGEIRVFNGYVTGTSLSRSANTVNVVVSATHWLMDLDASSTLSSQYVKGSAVPLLIPPVGDGSNVMSNGPNDSDMEEMTDNVWLLGLKKKFIKLCQSNTLDAELECAPVGQNINQVGGVNLTNNIALPRLNGTADGSFDDSNVVDVPNLKFVEILDAALDGALTQDIAESLYNASRGNSSVWDQLLGIARKLHFTVIPTIDSAVCAPLAPCLAGDDPPRHVTIKANEYWAAQPSEGVFRLYRGLSLHGQFTSIWGAYSAEDVQNGAYFPSDGCYIAENDPDLDEDVKSLTQRGSMVYDRAPDWLDDKSMRAVLLSESTNPDKNPTTSMQIVDDDAPLALVTEFTGPPAVLARDNDMGKRLGDAYAKWRYWNDTLLSRTGQITGKLRFDIAPGTIVRIEDIDGKLYDDPAEFGYLYAQVTGVQFAVDAQNKQAATTFTLSHIRRESERKMGTNGHPLYEDLWVGTVLQNVRMQTGGSGSNAAESVFIPSPGSHELKPR